MKINIRKIDNKNDLRKAFQIREQVFCIEQKVPYEIEMDEYDDIADHILATINDKAVGTARWRITEKGAKMERFAVLKEYRGLGVGIALVEFLLNELKEYENIYLNAQESVIPFYEKLGFSKVGQTFMEASIPHKRMVLKK